jgi:la-related protein 1
MDTEGWIDISMVGSFNRVKSLTPDLDIVKECMHLSSLLEVREDKVRLTNNESYRWVLPDAKACMFPPTSDTDHSRTEVAGELPLNMGVGVGMVIESDIEEVMSSMGAGGVQPKYALGEVENALMKNGGDRGNTNGTSVVSEVVEESEAGGEATSTDELVETVEADVMETR